MAKRNKPTQSEIDGVQYRRAKIWQIILYSCNAFVGMSVYPLIGYANYAGMIGFGMTAAMIGVVLTCARILDGITDPLLALLYDKIDTKFGKLRILIVSGFLIEAVALWLMFDALGSKGFGAPVFIALYVVYVIGQWRADRFGDSICCLHAIFFAVWRYSYGFCCFDGSDKVRFQRFVGRMVSFRCCPCFLDAGWFCNG